MELTEKPTFIVEAVKSGDWWALQCPSIKGMFSQARKLGDEAEAMAREAIAMMLGCGEDEFDIEIRIMEGN